MAREVSGLVKKIKKCFKLIKKICHRNFRTVDKLSIVKTRLEALSMVSANNLPVPLSQES